MDHIYDALSRYGCIPSDTQNFDTSIIVYFTRPRDAVFPLLDGELRIDRIYRNFEISAKFGDEIILPIVGQWEKVEAFLQKILCPLGLSDRQF